VYILRSFAVLPHAIIPDEMEDRYAQNRTRGGWVGFTLGIGNTYTDIIGAVSVARLHLMRDPRGRDGNQQEQRRGYEEGVCSLLLRSWTRGAGRSPRQPRERSPPWPFTAEGTEKLDFVGPVRELFGWQWGMVPTALGLQV